MTDGARSDFSAHLDLPDATPVVYDLLLGQPRTRCELTQALQADDRLVDHVLDRLQGMGLAHQDDDDRWDARAPQSAMRRVISDLDQQIAARRAAKDEARQGFAVLQDLYDRHQVERLDGQIKMLRSATQIRDTIEQLSVCTEQEVLAMHPTMAAPEALAEGLSLDRSLLSRGVDYKVLWPHTARRQRSVYGYIETLVNLGADLRTADVIPARAIVLDRRQAFVSVEEGEAAAVITQPVIVGFLVEVFHQCWDSARTVSLHHLTQEALEDIELRVLREMAHGRTDDAIARRLDVSTRTVRRYVSQMSERLHVTTRFQLALAALQMDALHPELPLSAADPAITPDETDEP